MSYHRNSTRISNINNSGQISLMTTFQPANTSSKHKFSLSKELKWIISWEISRESRPGQAVAIPKSPPLVVKTQWTNTLTLTLWVALGRSRQPLYLTSSLSSLIRCLSQSWTLRRATCQSPSTNPRFRPSSTMVSKCPMILLAISQWLKESRSSPKFLHLPGHPSAWQPQIKSCALQVPIWGPEK